MTRFAAAGLLVLAILSIGLAYLTRQAGTEQAIQSAERLTAMTAKAVAAPRLTPEFLAGEPAATQAFDDLIRSHLIDDSLVRVKLWTAQGRILYSDEPRLIGTSYPLGEEELQALHGGGTESEISDLGKPENRFEQPYGRLLEVYTGLRSSTGQPVLFEAYFRYDAVERAGAAQWRQYAPAALGALVLLELVQIPLAWSMARRLQRQQRDAERLLQHAVDASDAERRRIAADLHDGIVQQLAGSTFALDAARLGGPHPEQDTELITRTAADLRRIGGELRTLTVQIYPPDLAQLGLPAALTELANGLADNGVQVHLDADQAQDVPPPAAAVLFRAAQEILRNVASHAHSNTVTITVTHDGDVATLDISDNGQGFDQSRLPQRRNEGHIGLLALDDLIGNAGGRLSITSQPGHGTTVQVAVPTR
jgi:signal transduction histidine kinase